jgi:hypothetical protein
MEPFYKGLVVWGVTLYQLKVWGVILQMSGSLGGHFIFFPKNKKKIKNKLKHVEGLKKAR